MYEEVDRYDAVCDQGRRYTVVVRKNIAQIVDYVLHDGRYLDPTDDYTFGAPPLARITRKI